MKEYFKVTCPHCYWIGMSNECHGGTAIADTGDYSELTCPYCETIVNDNIDDEWSNPVPDSEIINTLRKLYSEKCKEGEELYYENLALKMQVDDLNKELKIMGE